MASTATGTKRPRDDSSDEPPTRSVIYYEPYVSGEDGIDRPLWLHNRVAGVGKEVDSTWPSVVTMQWREIKQLPLATFKAMQHPDPEQPHSNIPDSQIDPDFMNAGHPVVKLKHGWRQSLGISSFAYVCELSAAEKSRARGKRGGGATINFDTATQVELRSIVFEAADGHLEWIGDYNFSAEELSG